MTSKADKFIGTAEYEQGREAARGGIAKEDSPHAEGTDAYKAWLKGWKFEQH